MEKFISVSELRAMLGINRNAAYKLTEQPGFPVIRLGKRKLIPESILNEWLLSKLPKEVRDEQI